MTAFAVLALLSCGPSIVPLYEQARAEALAEPGPVPEHWKPDLVLHLSQGVVRALAMQGLAANDTLHQRVEVAALGVPVTITPDLKGRRVEVGPVPGCPACISVDATLVGPAKWTALGQRGAVDLKVRARFALEATTVLQAGVFTVTVAPRSIDTLDVVVEGAEARVGELVSSALGCDWQQEVLAGIAPIELGSVGSQGLPLRAARIVALESGGLQVEMLSSSPTPGILSVHDRALTRGFALYADQGSLLDLARAEAFRAGPVAHDVVVEPTRLAVDEGAFELGLRLWRPVGSGWWRDYTALGAISLTEHGVRLKATSVSEGPVSDGAELVDPLALLAEGAILTGIGDALTAGCPRRSHAVADGVRVSTEVTGVSGSSEAEHTGGSPLIVVSGTVAVVGP